MKPFFFCLVSSTFNHNLKIFSYSSALKFLNLQILIQWLRFAVRTLFPLQLSKGESMNQVTLWLSHPCSDQRKVKASRTSRGYQT